MKRALVAICLALVFAAQLYADVTVKSTGSGKGAGLSANVATTTYIKGLRMRVDTVKGDKTLTTIYDVPAQKIYMFDSEKKEADAWDMMALAQSVAKMTRVHDVKSSIKPYGQIRQIAGKKAEGYIIEVSLATGPTRSSGMYMTTRLTSHVWVVKDAPGTDDYAAFCKGAVEKGSMTLDDPKWMRNVPGQTWAIAKMYEQYTTLGGMLYESEMKSTSVGFLGSEPNYPGPHGVSGERNIFGKSMTDTIQSIDTGALSADLFLPPPSYKINAKR